MPSSSIQRNSNRIALTFILISAAFCQSIYAQSDVEKRQENQVLIRWFYWTARRNHAIADEIGLSKQQLDAILPAAKDYVDFFNRKKKSDSPEEVRQSNQKLQELTQKAVDKLGKVLFPKQMKRSREIVRQYPNQKDFLINNMQSNEMMEKFGITELQKAELDQLREEMTKKAKELELRHRKELTDLLIKRDELIKKQLAKKQREEYDKHFGKPIWWFADRYVRLQLEKWKEE